MTMASRAQLAAMVNARRRRNRHAGGGGGWTGPTSGPIDVFVLIGHSQPHGGQNNPEALNTVRDSGMLGWNGTAIATYQPNVNPAYTPAVGMTGLHYSNPDGAWSFEAKILDRYRAANPLLPVAMFKSTRGGSTAAVYSGFGDTSTRWNSGGIALNFATTELGQFITALTSAGYTPTIRAIFIDLGQNDATRIESITDFETAMDGILTVMAGWSNLDPAYKVVMVRDDLGSGAYKPEVREAIGNLAIKTSNVTWIDVDGLTTNGGGDPHWNAVALLEIGDRLWNAYVGTEVVEAKVIRTMGSQLITWWDPDFGLTLVSGNVAGWADRILGYDVTTGVAGNRPVPNASDSDFAGNPSLGFNGTTQQLTKTTGITGLPSGATEGWIWSVMNLTSLGTIAGSRALISYNGAANTNRTVRRTTVSNVNRAQLQVGNGATTITATDVAVDLSGVHVVLSKIKPTTCSIKVDNAAEVSAAVVPATSAAPTVLAIGSTGGTFFFEGDLGDQIMTASLSAARESAFRKFLGGRAGLSL